MTRARATPGRGLATTCRTKASHLPATPVALSLPAFTSASISGLLPSVPMSTTSRPLGGLVLKPGSVLVTRSTSACRSLAARNTPGQSAALA